MTLVLAAPALPLHTAGKYVAGAYIVFLALVLVYVGIMAARLGRTEREVTELLSEIHERQGIAAQDPAAAHEPVRAARPETVS